MGMTSNADDPRAGFEEALKSFGLDAPSLKGKTVGDRALTTIGDGIETRSNRKEGPDGERWQGNASSVIERKGRDDANVDTGALLSREQIDGEQSVSRNEASMTYGTDDDCRKKAHWAHEGQSVLRIRRPFYAMSDADVDAVVDGFAQDLIAHLTKG